MQRLTAAGHRAARLALLSTLLAAPLRAGLVENTNDAPVSSSTIGSFQPKLTSGASIVAVTNAGPRRGSLHYVSSIPVYTGQPRRAEIDDNQWGQYGNKILWYGVSYRVPDSGEWKGIRQFVGQLRFTNYPQGSSTISAIDMETGYGDVNHGGSGHHLVVDNGQWSFALRYQDPGVPSGFGLFSKTFKLGPVAYGSWTDFIMQARWTAGTEGFLKIWKQENGGGYTQVLDYHGPTWVDKYAEGSFLSGQPVNSPNMTAGLYYSEDARARSLDVDEVKMSDFPGPDGFDHVKPDGTYAPAPYPTASTDWTGTAIGVSSGSTSYDTVNGRFVIKAAGNGFTGTGDNLRFIHVPLPQDGELIARVQYLATANPAAEAGLMIRATTDALSPFVAVGMFPDGRTRAVAREEDASGARALNFDDVDDKTGTGKYLRLVRCRDHVSVHYSSQAGDTNWTSLAEFTVPLGTEPRVGFYVSGAGSTTSIEGRFQNPTLLRASKTFVPQRAPDPGVSALNARYRFENTLADSVPGGAALGSLFGAPAFAASGAPEGGVALSLNGASAVGFAGAPAVRPASDFTVSAWVKPVLGAAGTIVSGGDDNGFRLGHLADGTLALVLGNPASATPVATALSQTKLQAGVWQHVSVAIDCEGSAAYVTFFLNGAIAGTWGVDQGVIETGTAPFVVGARGATGGDCFRGEIDDLRVHLGPLTRDEAPLLATGTVLGADPALVDFEDASSYEAGEIHNQPGLTGTASWSSPNFLGLARVIGLANEGQVLELRPDARLFETVRYRPLASDLGLASETPANARVAFSLRLRFPDRLANDTTLTHTVSLFRDRSGTNQGRAVRLSLRRDGRVTLANNNQSLGTVPDGATWATLSGVADFTARTVTLRLGSNPEQTNVAFLNEGGTGLDEYGFAEFGASAAGVRVWIDDLDLVALP